MGGYHSCGEIRNISLQTAVWTAEMMLFGPDGTLYPTQQMREPPRRFGPGAVVFGCGLTLAFDYDSTNATARTYRLRVSYTLDDGRSGSVEGEGRMRPLLPGEEVTGIVINEFRPRGPNGPKDQFVELLNISSEPINVRGWFLQSSTRSDEVAVSFRSDLPDVTLGPGCSYLLTATNSPGSWPPEGTYSGSVPGDAMMRAIPSDASGLALRQSSGRVVDQVGFGSNTVYKEGVPLEPFGNADTDRSYSRTGPDTGDNSRHFRMVSPSTPRNSRGCR